MLHLDKVSLSLGQRNWLFDHTLDTHGVYGLLGRSGSGKSTLLNLIAGFTHADAGTIRWQGNVLTKLVPAQRPVTTLFQQHNLFSHLTVRQNTGLGLDPGLNLTSHQIQAVQSVLSDVGLSGYEHKLPGQLSGGEQQRVALARSLLRRRPVLLLDEPFSALDATTRQEMILLLQQVIQSYRPCVLMVTHDENDAIALQATILRIQENKLIQGTPTREVTLS